MRLFEAIIQANHRALAGDDRAGIGPEDHAGSLPVVLLTCIDPRLAPLIPEVLGIREEQFLWVRNAGNTITGPLSSTMRSLAMVCAIKGAREIAVIGHTDCAVRKTSVAELVDRFKAMGVERYRLPDNLHEFFGLFASEGQNVMRGVEFARQSPLIGRHIPVHGLILDVSTKKLDWVVNGYRGLKEATATPYGDGPTASENEIAWAHLADFQMEEMKFPDSKIGDAIPASSGPTAGGGDRGGTPSSSSSESRKKPPPPPRPKPPPIPPVVRLRQPWKKRR